MPTQPFAIGVAPEEGAWGDDRTFLFNSEVDDEEVEQMQELAKKLITYEAVCNY